MRDGRASGASPTLPGARLWAIPLHCRPDRGCDTPRSGPSQPQSGPSLAPVRPQSDASQTRVRPPCAANAITPSPRWTPAPGMPRRTKPNTNAYDPARTRMTMAGGPAIAREAQANRQAAIRDKLWNRPALEQTGPGTERPSHTRKVAAFNSSGVSISSETPARDHQGPRARARADLARDRANVADAVPRVGVLP